MQLCEGLPVELRLQDYRTYMKVVHRCLKDDGLFLLHTIGDRRSEKVNDPWIHKYIFPNSLIPSIGQIGAAADDLFIIEDVHNFGFYYDRTIMSRFDNFDRYCHSLKESYAERFYRMWKYYLLNSAESFCARSLQVWQIVLSKHGVPEGYSAIR